MHQVYIQGFRRPLGALKRLPEVKLVTSALIVRFTAAPLSSRHLDLWRPFAGVDAAQCWSSPRVIWLYRSVIYITFLFDFMVCTHTILQL